MMYFMKQSALEPGLLQTLRVYVILVTILLPLVWRAFSPAFGVEAPLKQSITPGQPVLVFLLIYLLFPWWQRQMGRAFLPVAFILLAAQPIVGNYLTLQWLVPQSFHEFTSLALMVRTWVLVQFLVLFVAWQYNLFWTMCTGIGLTLLDAALYFPVVKTSATFYPFYSTLVVGRLFAVTGAGLAFAWLMKRQREHRAALAEANQKLIQYAATTEQLAVSQERNRLARELHDTLAHSLSAVTVQLEAVQSLWEVKPAAARKILNQALQATRSGLSEARRALQALRATPLEDLGLAMAIRELAKSTAARGNLRLELDVQNHWKNLSLEVEQCVYRVAQEALTNVARHADAKSLRVSLRHDSGNLILLIADNGRGFDPAQANDVRYGLVGLRERAEIFGGRLEVESRPGQGASVKLTLPMEEVKQ